ncbi:uncharacterized protein LOC117102962, partial [Anneissia japonica]|uniref:uncharacterized protein LOC117102962 n=1 Tax=Anneissia japonica TaxID=1529436 RepID=UPI0014256D59
DGKVPVAESRKPDEHEPPLSQISISLIAVCGVLAVFVIVALVLSVKNKRQDVKPWIVPIQDNERSESRSRRMLPAAPKIEDNAYLFHTRSNTGGNDAVGKGSIPAHRQPENEDVTYSVVNDDLKAACRLLPFVSETPQEPPCPTDVYDSIQGVSLSPEGSMRSRIGSTPSYRLAGGFQRQNSTASTYEGSIRPFSRSTSVVSRTESFYEDMNKTSRSSSMCRPNDRNIVPYT